MGGKKSKSNSAKSLHPHEEETVLAFFGLQNKNGKISAANLKGRWHTMLIPSFLNQHVDYLVKKSETTDLNIVTMDAMVSFYLTFIGGTFDEMAVAIADLIGSTVKNNKDIVVSYNQVLKYLSDLINSYLQLLESKKDTNLMTWPARSRKFDTTSPSSVVKAWCADLVHEDNEVTLYHLESWLSHSGLVMIIKNLLVTSLYNLNDFETNLIPKAHLPSKMTTILDSHQIIYLNSVLPSEYRNQWRLLFSTKAHGESFSTMMGKIVNQGPSLLILKDSKSYTFGGFASESWHPGPKFVGNETCFLFTLYPETKVFNSSGYNNHYMYVNTNQSTLPNGIGMGGQFHYWGLWLDSHFGIGECSESCTTFRDYVMPAASKKFSIANLEIWGVGDPPPTPAELGERDTSILDKDPAVTQMLEMIGKKQYSNGLRESPALGKKPPPSSPQDDSDDNSDD